MSVQEMIRILLAIGFTEEAIATGVKVHKSTISRIFTGKTHTPRYHVTHRIEDIFSQYGPKNSLSEIILVENDHH
jgi:transcriptional regulator with XRE-family HTH domain